MNREMLANLTMRTGPFIYQIVQSIAALVGITSACQILEDTNLRRKLSIGALDWSRHFNWDNSAAEFNSLIQSIPKRGSS